MKKAMLVLFVLIALVSGAEAWEILNDKEFDNAMSWEFEPYDYTIDFSNQNYTKSVGFIFVRPVTFVNPIYKDEAWEVFICLFWVYIRLTLTKLICLILLIIILFAIIFLRGKTKKNEEEQGAKECRS